MTELTKGVASVEVCIPRPFARLTSVILRMPSNMAHEGAGTKFRYRGKLTAIRSRVLARLKRVGIKLARKPFMRGQSIRGRVSLYFAVFQGEGTKARRRALARVQAIVDQEAQR
jgi:hypothetical protein